MYILENFQYVGPGRAALSTYLNEYNAIRSSGWKTKTIGGTQHVVCDLGFKTEEDAMLFKLKFADKFI